MSDKTYSGFKTEEQFTELVSEALSSHLEQLAEENEDPETGDAVDPAHPADDFYIRTFADMCILTDNAGFVVKFPQAGIEYQVTVVRSK